MAQKLDKWSKGGTISGIEILRGTNYFPDGSVDAFGKTIESVKRRGKYLCFELLSGDRIICHNAMSGYWDSSNDPWTFDYVEGKRVSKEGDVRVKIHLHSPLMGNENVLNFHDARLFGRLYYYQAKERDVHFRGVGPEVLTTPMVLSTAPKHTDESFVKVIRESKQTLKETLLKQSLLAGVGNIYAAESLWLAKISPFKLGTEITDQQAVDLLYAIRVTLMRALERKLSYSELAIYRRKTCPECSSKVLQHSIRGRSTYYCGVCQS